MGITEIANGEEKRNKKAIGVQVLEEGRVQVCPVWVTSYPRGKSERKGNAGGENTGAYLMN